MSQEKTRLPVVLRHVQAGHSMGIIRLDVATTPQSTDTSDERLRPL
jgi:hypothetical protein